MESCIYIVVGYDLILTKTRNRSKQISLTRPDSGSGERKTEAMKCSAEHNINQVSSIDIHAAGRYFQASTSSSVQSTSYLTPYYTIARRRPVEPALSHLIDRITQKYSDIRMEKGDIA